MADPIYRWTRLGEVCLGLTYAIALLGVYIHVLSRSPLRVGTPCPAAP